jgi:hypothetical protein
MSSHCYTHVPVFEVNVGEIKGAEKILMAIRDGSVVDSSRLCIVLEDAVIAVVVYP